MSYHPALDGLRIGCVKYLNARPLIHTYEGPVQFDHPSDLAREIAAGQLDAALVPVFELFRSPGYLLVDDVAIASDGPVFSVFLAYRGTLANIRTIALDPASLTSVHLLQVLLAEFHGLRPACIDAREAVGKADAQLLIGNQAIMFRRSAPPDVQIMDLGAEWQKHTTLPFVYALWLLRPGLESPESVSDAFRALKREGLARLGEIASSEKVCPPEVATTYLTRHIRFDLGPREKAGLEKFGTLLVKHGFVGESDGALSFV